jgi:glycosyltransferase involved in cell wall biosynthesis
MEKIKTSLSVLIIAKNAEKVIGNCLNSVAFADQIIVLDNNSTDKTVEIAQKYHVSIFRYKSEDFSQLRNEIFKHTVSEWIMYVDADEVIPDKLKTEILDKIHNRDNGFSAYFVKRKTYYFGNYEWPYMDLVQRIFRKSSFVEWVGALHESPKYRGQIMVLNNPLHHFTHQNIAQMVDKTNKWSDTEAKLRFDTHHPSVTWWRFFRVMLTGFFDTFITKKGYRAGNIGVIESLYQSFSIFITYAKLWEMQQKNK